MTRQSDTLDGRTARETISRLATDRRARIPLALIGVLLLVTSAMLVASVGTRDEPTPQVDASEAVDGTEAAAQTAVRDGVQRAAEIAGEQPLTDASDTEWGEVLDAGDAADGSVWRIHPRFAPDDGAVARDTFTNYLRALIYLQVAANLEQTGQTVDDVSTSVSLPAIEGPETFEAAVDRVTLTESEPGTIDVTIEGIELNASSEGEVIEHRETTMNVTVATPILQLHERVRTFQSALEAGIMERGFAQRFNARIYAIGWARGYMQNYRLPIVEVIANRHIEPSANSAIYRTQQDVFGAADPELRNAVRLGWTCMAIKDGGAMFDQYMDSNNLDYRNVSHEGNELVFERDTGEEVEMELPGGAATAAQLCEGAQFLLGDQVTGEQPAAPGVVDLLGDAPGMNETETIGVDEAAYVPLARLADPTRGNSFVSAIDRIYTIEGDADSSAATLDSLSFSGSATCTNATSNGGTYREPAGVTVSQVGIDPIDPHGEQYFEAESIVEAQVEQKLACAGETDPTVDEDSFRIRVTTVFSEFTASPNATIDAVNNVGIDPYKYERGSEMALVPPEFRNYEGAGTVVTETMLGGEIGTGAHASWVESALPDDVTGESDVTGAVSGALTDRQEVDIDHGAFLDAKLAAAMAEDIQSMQQDAAEVSHEFSRPDLLRSGADSPFTRLRQKVEAELRAAYLERDQPYRSVGQKALYEARHAYLRTLVDRLEVLEAGHEEAVGTIDDELADLDSGVDNALTFLQQGVSADEPDPIPLASSELTENVTYEVSGSPTYLVAENLTKHEVPAIDEDTGFVPFAMKNKEYVDLPYEEVIGGLITRVANAIGLGEPDAEIGFRMAGDVLLAGDLAVAANDTTERFDEPGRAQELAETLDVFEGNVEDALEEFYGEVAKETVVELYPSPVAECTVLDPPEPDGDVDPRRPAPPNPGGADPCQEIVDEADEDLVGIIEDAETAIAAATEEGVAGFETGGEIDVALKTVAVGRGNATEPIVDNVTAALDDASYRYGAFDDHLDASQWSDVVGSAVQPAVERASAMKVKIADDADRAEDIDTTLQTALSNVTAEMIEDRLEEVGDDVADAISGRAKQWAGTWAGTAKRPARIPAGLPLLPLPTHWYATMNVWDIEVAGEYARFEASANMGTPEHTTATAYVRENMTVTHEIAGETRELGSVEPIDFSGRSHLVVITPRGVGVGDRDDENPECSPHFPVVGEFDGDEEPRCGPDTYGYPVSWTEARQPDAEDGG